MDYLARGPAKIHIESSTCNSRGFVAAEIKRQRSDLFGFEQAVDRGRFSHDLADHVIREIP